METPLIKEAEIRYTLDGSEPNPSSLKYDKPFTIDATTTLKVAAFDRRDKVSAPNKTNYFVRLPGIPAKPEVTPDKLDPVKDQYAQISDVHASFLWLPVLNRSYEDKTLRIREKTYDTGIGMRAPAYIRYMIKPEWKRFVALAGVDDNMLTHYLGANIAGLPKVVFKVFIDGNLSAESPVMRISLEPWRFDVPVPAGSRQIVLVCDDMGVRSPYNLGNWVEAGFCTK